MVRISRDKDIKNKEHRALSHFIRKSWAELPAGKRKSYMKPQCVVSISAVFDIPISQISISRQLTNIVRYMADRQVPRG